MKCKVIVGFFSLFLIWGAGFKFETSFPLDLKVGMTVYASTDLYKLNPNEYKEKEFKHNKEYLHNEALLEIRKNIREEQKKLDFLPKDKNSNEKIKEELFINNFENRKTIAYESTKYQLFSSELNAAKEKVSNATTINQSKSKNLRIIYIGILIVSILVVLIWLVPKMVQSEKK